MVGGRSVDRVETAVWVLSDTGKWGRLGELPIPLIGPAARIIDDRLVVPGGAPRGCDLLPMVWVPTLKRKGRAHPMNEPNKQPKRREFLKNAKQAAALALGAPGWRSLLAAAGPNAAAIPQGSIPSEPSPSFLLIITQNA